MDKEFPSHGILKFPESNVWFYDSMFLFLNKKKTRLAFVILAWKATTMIPPAASDYASITYNYQQLFSCND